MKHLLLTALCITCFGSTVALAQDNCKVFGQKNPHGVAMEIKPPMYVVDSLNFMVESVKPLPYAIGNADTVFFNVCLVAKDGQKHSTQVRYNTTHGMVSYSLSMQAPLSGVTSASLEHPALSVVYPNPSKTHASIEIGSDARGMQLEIYTNTGALYERLPAVSGKLDIPVTSFTPGTYLIRLRSDEKVLAEEHLVVSH